jgi:hypothetical protein
MLPWRNVAGITANNKGAIMKEYSGGDCKENIPVRLTSLYGQEVCLDMCVTFFWLQRLV